MSEKSINEISRDARLLFIKANEAGQRENVDYAIALYNQVLEKEPGFLDCRKALRAAQFQKAGAKGGGFFKRMLSGAGSSPLVAKAKVVLLKNPADAMAIAEQILNSDPNSSAGHRIIVDGANALDLPQTAALSLDIMARNSPKDKGLAIEYAHAVGTAGGDTSQAEKILADLIRNSPNDGELNQALKDLSARKTLDQGGYNALEGGQGSYRDILKDKEKAASLEQEQRVQKSEDIAEKLIGEYEARLKTEPNNLKLVRSLAELYAQKNQFDRSLAYFDRIKNSDMGNDPSLERLPTRTYDDLITVWSSSIPPRRITPNNPPKFRRKSWNSRWPSANGGWKNIRRTWRFDLRWASCIFKSAKSTRPSRNFKRRRAIRTSGWPP